MKKLIGIVLVTMTNARFRPILRNQQQARILGHRACGYAASARSFKVAVSWRTVLRAVAPRKHLWRILELRGYRRRQPWLQSAVDDLVGSAKGKEKGAARSSPFLLIFDLIVP